MNSLKIAQAHVQAMRLGLIDMANTTEDPRISMMDAYLLLSEGKLIPELLVWVVVNLPIPNNNKSTIMNEQIFESAIDEAITLTIFALVLQTLEDTILESIEISESP